MIRRLFLASTCLFLFNTLLSQITISIDFTQPIKPISPYLFGRNNSLSNFSFGSLSPEDMIRLKDAKVKVTRENGGNNSTKYNWRRRLQSHPDWYNNVYTNDWGKQAVFVQNNFNDLHTLFSFQLIGKAAKSNEYNFNDWAYNQSKWWVGVGQNLAGNGVLNLTGTKAKADGDINLYLEDWNADSTTGILSHFFDELKLRKDRLVYWNMDNEPEIWAHTHDDVIKSPISAENFVQKYIEVAKKAKALYPQIKLLGPSPANEWQWYTWENDPIVYQGKTYPWVEYFIKRIADEQKKSGIKLLDLVDLHFYPGTQQVDQIAQLHRVFYDKEFIYPEANGVKKLNGGWDPNQTKEYIFHRINEWLITHIGKDHQVGLAMTECSIASNDATANAIWYATMLGEFTKNGVELFTPWDWKVGMWEVLHLISTESKAYYLPTEAAEINKVMAFATGSRQKDSITVFLINKTNQLQAISMPLTKFSSLGQVNQLNDLPNYETFFSKSINALKKFTIQPINNIYSTILPPYSITSISIIHSPLTSITQTEAPIVRIFPNPGHQEINILATKIFDQIKVYTISGILLKKIICSPTLNKKIAHDLPSGVYLVESSLQNHSNKSLQKVIVL